MGERAPDSGETERLLERARAGDREAFGLLFARHRPYLRKVVGLRLPRRLRARVDPSDAVQQAQVEALRGGAAGGRRAGRGGPCRLRPVLPGPRLPGRRRVTGLPGPRPAWGGALVGAVAAGFTQRLTGGERRDVEGSARRHPELAGLL